MSLCDPCNITVGLCWKDSHTTARCWEDRLKNGLCWKDLDIVGVSGGYASGPTILAEFFTREWDPAALAVYGYDDSAFSRDSTGSEYTSSSEASYYYFEDGHVFIRDRVFSTEWKDSLTVLNPDFTVRAHLDNKGDSFSRIGAIDQNSLIWIITGFDSGETANVVVQCYDLDLTLLKEFPFHGGEAGAQLIGITVLWDYIVGYIDVGVSGDPGNYLAVHRKDTGELTNIIDFDIGITNGFITCPLPAGRFAFPGNIASGSRSIKIYNPDLSIHKDFDWETVVGEVITGVATMQSTTEGYLVVLSGGKIFVVDWENDTIIDQITFPASGVSRLNSLSVREDGRFMVASGSAGSNTAAAVTLRDYINQQTIWQATGAQKIRNNVRAHFDNWQLQVVERATPPSDPAVSAEYETDFTDDTIGSVPDGWSVLAGTNDWSVETVDGQKGLSFTGVSGLNILEWDDVVAGADMEATARIRVEQLGSATRLRLCPRLSTSDNFYLLDITGGGSVRMQLWKRVSGSFSHMGNDYLQFTAIPEDTWINIKMRVMGDIISCRAWLASEDEPDTWGLSVKDGDLASGGFGLSSVAASSLQDNWFDDITLKVFSS